MTPDQQIDYLISQVQQLSVTVEAGNRGNNPEKASNVRDSVRDRASHLLGYMTAMEHAGTLPQAIADELAAALNQVSQ